MLIQKILHTLQVKNKTLEDERKILAEKILHSLQKEFYFSEEEQEYFIKCGSCSKMSFKVTHLNNNKGFTGCCFNCKKQKIDQHENRSVLRLLNTFRFDLIPHNRITSRYLDTSPLGSGKTYDMASKIIRLLKERKRVLFIAQNKATANNLLIEIEKQGFVCKPLNCLAELKINIKLYLDSQVGAFAQFVVIQAAYFQLSGYGQEDYTIAQKGENINLRVYEAIREYEPHIFIDELDVIIKDCSCITRDFISTINPKTQVEKIPAQRDSKHTKTKVFNYLEPKKGYQIIENQALIDLKNLSFIQTDGSQFITINGEEKALLVNSVENVTQGLVYINNLHFKNLIFDYPLIYGATATPDILEYYTRNGASLYFQKTPIKEEPSNHKKTLYCIKSHFEYVFLYKSCFELNFLHEDFLINHIKTNKKILIVKGAKKTAQLFFNSYKNHISNMFLADNKELSFLTPVNVNNMPSFNILVTYLMHPLMRGSNFFADFDLIICDFHKYDLNPAFFNVEMIINLVNVIDKKALVQDFTDVFKKQAIGRAFRGKQKPVFVFNNCPYEAKSITNPKRSTQNTFIKDKILQLIYPSFYAMLTPKNISNAKIWNRSKKLLISHLEKQLKVKQYEGN